MSGWRLSRWQVQTHWCKEVEKRNSSYSRNYHYFPVSLSILHRLSRVIVDDCPCRTSFLVGNRAWCIKSRGFPPDCLVVVCLHGLNVGFGDERASLDLCGSRFERCCLLSPSPKLLFYSPTPVRTSVEHQHRAVAVLDLRLRTSCTSIVRRAVYLLMLFGALCCSYCFRELVLLYPASRYPRTIECVNQGR